VAVISTPAARRGSPFGALRDGTKIERYELENDHGLSVAVLTYGGIVQSVLVPDHAGRRTNVALGFGDLEEYTSHERANPFMGALIGRYANRIGGARFTLDGREFDLTPNEAPNCLHGGTMGFDRAVWSARAFDDDKVARVCLSHTSPDGDQGFPGTLTARVTYTVERACNRLRVHYVATTNAPTVASLTTHVHWNLAGEDYGSIEDHELRIFAGRYTPVDRRLIPTGELAPVGGTPMDFRTPCRIGARIRDGFEQLRFARGYDHNWALDHGGTAADAPAPAAGLRDPRSGRTMMIRTSEPGLQVYTDNGFDGSLYGTGGRQYRQAAGVALEPQRFPDSPNQPGFPSATLRPGATLQSTTIYDFTAEER
jgi:aldose 1-epimerase